MIQEQEQKQTPPLGAQVLVVDDEPLILTSLSRLLTNAGYRVHIARNGNEAVRNIETNRYDLILLDLKMPGLTGHEVMDRIQEKRVDTMVIVVSGDVSIESAISAIRRGAYDFVRKPYEPDEILKRVQNALASRQLELDNRNMAKRLQRSEQWHRYLVNSSLDLIYSLDTEGRFTFVNNAVERILGFPKRELLGKHYTTIVHDEDVLGAAHLFNERRTGERSVRVELRLKHVDESRLHSPGKRFVPVELNAMGMYDSDGDGQRRFIGTYGVVRDIADRKRAEKTIAYQAYHDLLTGLPNRALFQDRLAQAINQAKRDNTQLAVMFLDLDKFKFVNDSLGHVAGDKLLKTLAARLRSCLREVDTLARLGGDEFVLLLPQINEATDATLIAEKILLALQQKFVIGDHELFASVSIGIVLYPDDADTSENLIKRADVAMYHAKNQGRNNYQLFNYAMDAQASGRLALVRDLRNALDHSEFEMHYHPQVDIPSGRIVGFEALLRWNHPTHGLLSPSSFIHLAEETGIILQIGEWVLRTVCGYAIKWRDAGLPPVRIAVNISPQQIQKPHFADNFLKLLEEHQLDPALIGIEITESTIMKDVEQTIPKLIQLGEAGVEISLDDFGTGYSSLSYLTKLPIHTLKVDQSFIRDIPRNAGHLSIVNAIATMARGLGLRLVVEGVETQAQLDSLIGIGCKEYQGFLFAQPLPSGKATDLLRGNHAEQRAEIKIAS
ncbi:MAG: putative bifunctional diguanylate cyclase/phosphodiesterase [Burkholderiales bacterium]